MAPSESRTGPFSITIIIPVGPVIIGRLGRALVAGHSLIVAIVGILGRPWGSLAPSELRTGSLPIALVGTGAPVLRDFFINGEPGVLSLVTGQLESTSERHHHGEDQDKFDTHWTRYVKIII